MTYDAKKKEYLMKYFEKLKEIRFRVKPEEYEEYEAAAKEGGYPSMRQFYLDAINEKTKKIEKSDMEETGMTDLQFKSWLRQIIRGLENAKDASSKEETDQKLDCLLKDLKEDLKK